MVAKRKFHQGMGAKRRNFHEDMISNLPENVIETILMHLTTRDAVRTSILSRNWRHRWAKLPQLILDKKLWRKKRPGKNLARNTVGMILCQLQLVHQGPMKKFTLSIPGLACCPEIDNLIYFLLRNGIEDLTLEMLNGHYRLPLLFFTYQQLRHLSLRSCLIETSLNFKGFSRLISLKLCHVTVRAKVLQSLISSCPLLEQLDVVCDDISSAGDEIEIEIDAANLKTFSFSGTLKPISIAFRNAPHLASVSIPFDCIIKHYLRQSGKCNFNEFFNGLPVLKKLYLACPLDKSLAAEEVPTRLLTTSLFYLKDLDIWNIKLNELVELSFILCLMRSSPHLNRIHIRFHKDSISETNNRVLQFLEEQDYSDITLNELEDVQLENVTATRPQLQLIEILLTKSRGRCPNKMNILMPPEVTPDDERFELVKELTNFPVS